MRVWWVAKGLMAFLGGILWLAAASGQGPGARADDRICTPEHAGELTCQAGVRCSCKFFAESLSTGTPAGYRWDCGILRARCGGDILGSNSGDRGLPVTLPDSFRGPYPAVVTIDRSETNLTNSQSQSSTQTNTQTNN